MNVSMSIGKLLIATVLASVSLKAGEARAQVVDWQATGNGGAVSGGGSDDTTGFRTAEVNLGPLSAAAYALTLGGFNNKKTYNNEGVEVVIDDVRVTARLVP